MASRKSIETSNSNSAPRYTLFLRSSICIPNFFVHGSVICDLCTKKLGMQIELHRNNVYLGAELLLLVSMLFWGAEGAPILFSVLGFSMASCS